MQPKAYFCLITGFILLTLITALALQSPHKTPSADSSQALQNLTQGTTPTDVTLTSSAKRGASHPAVQVQDQTSTSSLPPAPTSGYDPPDLLMNSENPLQLQAAINYIEWIRTIPDAAPLLEEIITYLQTADESDFSIENLPKADNGLSVVTPDASAYMITDPKIRTKWNKLMELVANARSHEESHPY